MNCKTQTSCPQGMKDSLTPHLQCSASPKTDISSRAPAEEAPAEAWGSAPLVFKQRHSDNSIFTQRVSAALSSPHKGCSSPGQCANSWDQSPDGTLVVLQDSLDSTEGRPHPGPLTVSLNDNMAPLCGLICLLQQMCFVITVFLCLGLLSAASQNIYCRAGEVVHHRERGLRPRT